MSGVLGFIGLGSMGAPIVERLLSAGHKVVAHDARSQSLIPFEGRLRVAKSPKEVADQARIVFVSLPTPDVVKQVALGTDGVAKGTAVKVYVDLSTTGPKAAEEVGATLCRHGIAAVDAPVSGGVAGAAAGTLALMVSGADEAVREAMPFLQAFGQPKIVGESVGMGQSLKLINNMMAGAHLALTAEAMVLGVKAGLEPEIMLEVLNMGSGRNSATEDRFPKHVLPRTFNNGFANVLMRKDIRLCMDMAESLQVPLWLGTAVDRLWMQTVLQVGPDKNTTSIVQTIEQWAGVEVRGKAVNNPKEKS